MIDYKMTLTDEQKEILEGKKGETLKKIMETVVLFGDIFDAKRLVPVTHLEGHLVTSFGIPLLHPLFDTMKELNDQNIKVIRIPNNQIDNNFTGVCEYVDKVISMALNSGQPIS